MASSLNITMDTISIRGEREHLAMSLDKKELASFSVVPNIGYLFWTPIGVMKL